jgi:hypothetical protein
LRASFWMSMLDEVVFRPRGSNVDNHSRVIGGAVMKQSTWDADGSQ